MSNESSESGLAVSAEPVKAVKAKPIKVLPTERLGFEKQLGVLRGYAAAAGADRKAVSNRDVGSIVQIHENTVSICNPFFQDVGLLAKEGMRNRPSDEVADYAQAFEWDSEKAAAKLAGVFRKSWFGAALIPKLTFRQLSRDEATSFLANEAKAPKEYKANLEILLEYLRVAGVIHCEGSVVYLGPNAKDAADNGGGGIGKASAGSHETVADKVPPQVPQVLDRSPVMEPLIRGLIEKLPEPDGTWSLVDRAKWLNAAANIFDLMYQGGGDEGIEVSLEGSTLSIRKKG